MTFGSRFWKKGHCIHILWCIFMGLGQNDPWVESRMWPQQPWGQRSSRGQWLFLTLTGVGSNLILQWLHKYVIAKTGETRGSRTALLYFEFEAPNGINLIMFRDNSTAFSAKIRKKIKVRFWVINLLILFLQNRGYSALNRSIPHRDTRKRCIFLKCK